MERPIEKLKQLQEDIDKEHKDGCIRCKLAWLERKYDTYPSEDGKWEVEDGNDD